MACSRKLNLTWIDASHLESTTEANNPADFHTAWTHLCKAEGIIVPGGFGPRGTEGMIRAAKWARKNKTPYLGICLGMQIAVIEFARNVCKISNAASVEFDAATTDPVVIHMPEIDSKTLGGTMRLGLRPTHFQEKSEWSKVRALYSNNLLSDVISPQHTGTNLLNGITATSESVAPATPPIILERHRHRYEINPAYVDILTSNGLDFVGKDDKSERMEILELQGHPWFVGVQFHPEYLSRVLRPSKPYLGFVAASAGCLDEVISKGAKERGEDRADDMNGVGI